MPRAAVSTQCSLLDAIARHGLAFVHAVTMHELLAAAGPLSDWNCFASSWDRLELDAYMADGERYRRRRHAVYGTQGSGGIERKPHQPHYQSVDYNPMHGGILR